MHANEKGRPARTRLTIPYFCIRNISSPEDTANDRKIFSGQMPVWAILDLPTDENVRGYLVEAEGKEGKPASRRRCILQFGQRLGMTQKIFDAE